MVTRARVCEGGKRNRFEAKHLVHVRRLPVSLKCATKAALISEMALPRFDRNKAGVSLFDSLQTRGKTREQRGGRRGDIYVIKPSGGGRWD